MNVKYVSILGLAALALAGCSVGMAPKPMDDGDLKNALDKIPPQDQINYIKAAPMNAQAKAARIKEIEDKTGYKDKNAGTTAPANGAPKTGP